MPRVTITEECLIWTGATTNVVYSPAENILAPDDHIDRIVAAGKGVRLTERGDELKDKPGRALAPKDAA